MNISMVAALARNNVIGANGGIPWKIPSDLKWFKNVTKGGTVIMGRKTYESLGRPKGLPGRRNIVLTSTPWIELTGERPLAFPSLEIALRQCEEYYKAEEVFLIGGQRVYEQGMSHANKMYLSHVDATVEGDTFFPEVDPKMWRRDFAFNMPQLSGDEYSFEAVIYHKRED